MVRNSEEGPLIVAQAGPLNGKRWTLRKSLLIGREPNCDIVIADRQVSRHHAQLKVTRSGIYLEDLGSKNGTHHNGNELTDEVLLQDGDVIQIALTQKFLFLNSDSTIPLDTTESEFVALQGAQVTQHPQSGRLRLDKRARRVWIAVKGKNQPEFEKEVLPPLSVSQFRLLELLYDQPGNVVSRFDLVTAIWGKEQAFEVSEQALDALVRRLRDRIASVDPHHEYIITVRGHGLRLENPPF